MANKTINVAIKGISPLLMHSFPMVPIEALEKKTPEEQAEFSTYRKKDNELYIPAVNLQRALIAAAAYSKGKGRSSLQKPVAACVMVGPEYLPLGTKEYVIDSRPVVVPATKGRILRHRPKLENWQTVASIEWDSDMLTEVQLRRIVDDCGSKVGLLDFRPERKGPFGRFIVVKWGLSTVD